MTLRGLSVGVRGPGDPQSWSWTQVMAWRSRWDRRLPRAVLDEVSSFVSLHPEACLDLEAFELDDDYFVELPALASLLRQELESGTGFCVVRLDVGLEAGRTWSEEQRRWLFLALGQALGRVQRLPGPDSGLAEAGLRTLPAPAVVGPDVAAWLAVPGGDPRRRWRLANARCAVVQLERRSPRVVEQLRRIWLHAQPGRGLPSADPIVSGGGGYPFVFRYGSLGIQRGQAESGLPLDAERLAALAALDRALADREHAVDLVLEPGSALFVRNDVIAHEPPPGADGVELMRVVLDDGRRPDAA